MPCEVCVGGVCVGCVCEMCVSGAYRCCCWMHAAHGICVCVCVRVCMCFGATTKVRCVYILGVCEVCEVCVCGEVCVRCVY